MDLYYFVRPKHLNHHGNLFGGQLLLWVDEFAWLTATKDYPESQLVTRALDRIEFRNAVPCGSMLRFQILPHKKGKTSIQYDVNIYRQLPGSTEEVRIFSTLITFVSIDKHGNKKQLPVKAKLQSEDSARGAQGALTTDDI